MPFNHKSTVYKSSPVKNPFNASGDEAYAELLWKEEKRSMFYLRVFGFGSLGLFAITLVLFFYAVSLQRTIPILVNVMPSGEAAYLGEVRQTGQFQVPEAAIFYQVRKYISNIRSISTDPQVLYNNINDCYSMVTSSYESILTRMLRANSPFPLVGKIRRSVEFESTLRITGNSYQVDWIETSVEPNGAPVSRKMRALVTVTLLTPDQAQNWIRVNPLGIFIENCEWTEI
jgi:type IV secretion system protein VirB5